MTTTLSVGCCDRLIHILLSTWRVMGRAASSSDGESRGMVGIGNRQFNSNQCVSVWWPRVEITTSEVSFFHRSWKMYALLMTKNRGATARKLRSLSLSYSKSKWWLTESFLSCQTIEGRLLARLYPRSMVPSVITVLLTFGLSQSSRADRQEETIERSKVTEKGEENTIKTKP